MTQILDLEDSYVAEYFRENGAHLIPFFVNPNNGQKQPKGGFNYKSDNRKIESMEELSKYIVGGYYIGLLPVVSGMLVIDFDLPLILSDGDMARNGFDWKTRKEYIDFKKKQWKQESIDNPQQVADMRNISHRTAKEAGFEPFKTIPSVSGKGWHHYYKLAGTRPKKSLPKNSNIEIRCAAYNVVIPSQWKELNGFFEGGVQRIGYKKIVEYWLPRLKYFDQLTPPPKSRVDTSLLKPGGFDSATMKFDYESYALRSGYSTQGRNSKMFVKLVMAYSINDYNGINEIKSEAKAAGLSDTEIRNTEESARRKASSRTPNWIYVDRR